MDLNTFTSSFAALPTDWIIIGTFALLMFIDAVRVGSGRIATLAIAALVTLLVTAAIPNAAFLGFVAERLSTPVLQAALFAVVLVFVFLLIRRVYIDYGEENGQVVQAVLAAVAVTAVVLVVWLQVPALDGVWRFGDQVRAVFGDAHRFWWLMVSLAALAFAKA